MTNLGEIATPFKCISYYVSTKSSVDNQHSYCYWFRGKLIRIISKKPFARGDMLIVPENEPDVHQEFIAESRCQKFKTHGQSHSSGP